MIVNRQRVRVHLLSFEAFLRRARSLLRLRPDSFTVCLVSTQEIARLNRTFRGKRSATDVLSFPAGNDSVAARTPEAGRRSRPVTYLGDIAIAPAVARRNARRFARTFADEMNLLILHGVLHLMGYDHETDKGQMERRERLLRRRLGLA